MKYQCLITIPAIAGLLLTQPFARAAVTGGAHLVVFPKFNAASTSNLTAAVNEAAPPAFELSQCPFFGGDGRWTNTTAFLHGVNPSIKIRGVFFLSFHSDQPGYDLFSRAGDLNAYLTNHPAALGGQTPMDKMAHVVISPQLEDYYDDATWSQITKQILDKMDEAKILKSGKVALRRSLTSNNSSTLTNLNYSRGANRYSFAVTVEIHNITPPRQSKAMRNYVWSNDGSSVYYPLTLDGVVENASSDPLPGISMSSFIADANNREGTTKLWRPAYNLTIRTVSRGVVYYGANPANAWDRVDTQTAFDEREKDALVTFLKGLK